MPQVELAIYHLAERKRLSGLDERSARTEESETGSFLKVNSGRWKAIGSSFVVAVSVASAEADASSSGADMFVQMS